MVHSRGFIQNRAVICIIFLVFLALFYSIKFRPVEYGAPIVVYPYVELRNSNQTTLFDTCTLTAVDPLDKNLLPFHHPTYNSKSGCTPYIPLTALKNGRLSLGKRAANYQCHARCISHVDERNYRYENWTSLPSSEIFTCDIIETLCVSGFRTEGFLHSQIYEHPPDDNANDGTLPNVYIIIIDSVSSSMAKRSLSKSISFLKERMGGTLMEFLNRVGVNSKPNGFPLIFGKSIEAVNRDTVAAPSSIEDWNEPVICREFLDKYDHHLKQFKFYGYKTMIAQDGGAGIAFYPNCSGFKRTEADHMWRPFYLRLKTSKILRDSLERSCNERHLDMMDYLEKFINSYPGIPKIGQIWPTLLAHDSLKNLYHADEQFLTFFKNNEKVLENAFVFFMGDHGPRGEGYQPIYNFTDSSYLNMEPLSKGSSLLREWRGVRNCRTLPIPSKYCLCQYNKTKVTDTHFHEKLGNFMAKTLNELLDEEGLSGKCHLQEYYSTSSVLRYEDVNDTVYYTSVYLRPSDGLFSAYIRETSTGFQMASGVSRKNPEIQKEECLRGSPYSGICHCNSST